MGKLYLVATPIGNLDDVSKRALQVLQDAHMVACEDTRHTQILLRRYEIRAKHLTSYTEFNHKRKAAELVGHLGARRIRTPDARVHVRRLRREEERAAPPDAREAARRRPHDRPLREPVS